MATHEEKRRTQRFPFEQLNTEAQVGGKPVTCRISDFSESGVRLVMEEGVEINPNQEIVVGVGAISPNVKGRVRWITRNEADPDRLELGVEFESFLIVQPNEAEVQGLLEAWQEISHSYDLFESFLQILVLVDFEVVDGKILDLSDAVYSIGVWMSQRIGPINLWGLLRERDDSISVSPLVVINPIPESELPQRLARVAQVANGELTEWFDGMPYLYGGDLVLEFLGQDQGNTDLLQRLVLLLSRRIQLWSKILMKNISLQLLGEEMERIRSKTN